MPESKIRKLTATACNVIHQGTNKNGEAYSIYEVFAVDESGTPVEAKLRAFEPLDLNKLVEYEVARFESPRHGISFTLKVPGKKKTSTPPTAVVVAEVKALEARINRLEAKVEEVIGHVNVGEDPGDQISDLEHDPVPDQVAGL